MSYIDCHCHLAAKEFDDDLKTVIEDAKNIGVKAIVIVTEFGTEFEKTLDICRRFDDICVPCLGVHPVQGSEECQHGAKMSELNPYIEFMEDNVERIVGVGEVGLDFTPFYTKEENSKDEQRSVLTRQIEFAKKHNLPLNVHSRSAGKPAINLLVENGAKNVLLHAFNGNPKAARQGVAAGFYFSIPPCVARSEQKQKLVQVIPLENMMLETDAPALGPVKMERNLPKNIEISCNYIAEIKKISTDEVRGITSQNAMKLFPKIKQFIGD